MIHEDDAYVLVDLRSPKAVITGHIKGAVSIPEGALVAAKDKFPKKKSAPIILYSDGQASAEAFATVRGWGYKNTTALKGGAKAWDGKFFPGDPGSKIVYVKKLKPGQISAADFKKVASEKPQDKLILDVRDAGTEGQIPGSLNIPLGQLNDRISEVPKDKEIIVHCNTGVMASMSIKTLQENGYQVSYLDAVVQVSPDGSFEITDK
jgi:rhodanese-related sulfurtransferase